MSYSSQRDIARTVFERRNLIERLQILQVFRQRSHHLLHHSLRIFDFLSLRRRRERYVHIHAVAKQIRARVVVEDDSGTVQKRNIAIDLDFLRFTLSHARYLHAASESGGRRHADSARSLQRVNQRGLSHVGIADDSHRDRRLHAVVSTVVLEQLEKTIRS